MDLKGLEMGWRCRPGILRGSLPVLDLVGCALLVAIFVDFLVLARALPAPMNKIDIGAGGFPELVAIGTLLAVSAVAVSAVVRLIDAVPVAWVSIRRPIWVVGTAALLIAQSICFETLGTMPSVMFFAVATMFACGERRLLHLVSVPLILAAFIYTAFVLALSVNLP